MSLESRWPLDDGADLRDALVAAYSSPERGYHDTLHLTEVLDRLDELAAAGETFDDVPVRLAAWFHDVVYDGLPGAEDRSAVWAERALVDTAASADTAEVARLVRLTEGHDPAPGDREGWALCDADLAILAADAPRYAAYVAGVRRDHAHVPDDAFAAGRAAVLDDLLARGRLFGTGYGREVWEPRARVNLAAERSRLSP